MYQIAEFFKPLCSRFMCCDVSCNLRCRFKHTCSVTRCVSVSHEVTVLQGYPLQSSESTHISFFPESLVEI